MSQPPSSRDQSKPLPHDLEAFWHAISTSSLDGFWVNTLDGRLLHVNDAYCRMSGYSRDELLSMRVSDLEATESAAEILAHARKVEAQGCDRFETQHRTRDGGRIALDVSLTLVPEHKIIVAFLRDITTIKADRKRLEETLDFNRNLLETANVLIVGLNLDGDVRIFNPYAEKITGYAADELIGRNWFELLVPRARYPQVYSEFERLLAGGLPRTFENPILTKSGEERYIAWSNSELIEDGYCVGTLSFGTDITDKKRAKDALHASQQLYSNLVETAQDGIWCCDREGIFTYHNRAVSETLGYASDEILGHHFGEFVPPERLERETEVFAELMRSADKITNYETVRLRKNGERAWVLVNARPVFNADGAVVGLQGTAKDITERKLAEEALRISEQYQRAIIDNAPFGAHFYALSGDGSLVFERGNPAADRILDIDHLPLAGRPILEAFPGLADTDFPDIFTRLARDGGTHHRDHLAYDRGEIRGVFEIVAFQTVPGRMSVFFTNITERMRNEQELIRAREEALQASRAKDDFLGVISHELRTPLTPILGFAEMLALQCTDAYEQELLRHITEAGRRMLRMVEEILDFSRLASKPSQLHPRAFLPGSFFRREVQRCGDLASGNRLEYEPPDGRRFRPCPEGQAVVSDPEVIAQVLGNLINNACKFTERGTVTVRFGVEAGNEERGTLVFEVEDTGIGIPSDQFACIWEPFSQVDASATRSFGGVGLGLAICRKLVERLDGVIDVSSTPGEGSCFRVVIPVTLQPLPENAPREERREEPQHLATPARVLIVEDNDKNRLTLETQVRTLGGDPLLAVDGEEALDLMRIHGPGHFDLVLMDLHLPQMSGFEVSEQLQALYPPERLPPIIAISADVSERARSESRRCGIRDFLAKPVSLAQLQAKLAQWLKRPPTPSE